MICHITPRHATPHGERSKEDVIGACMHVGVPRTSYGCVHVSLVGLIGLLIGLIGSGVGGMLVVVDVLGYNE
jgi:hypothetical protein